MAKKTMKYRQVPSFIPIILAFLLGIGLCLIVINGRPARKPVYLLAEVDIKDYKTFAEYAQKSSEIIGKYGGRYLARGGKIIPMEGNWVPDRLILIKFDNTEQLDRCFNSPEYLEIKPLRDESSVSRAVIVSGYTKK